MAPRRSRAVAAGDWRWTVQSYEIEVNQETHDRWRDVAGGLPDGHSIVYVGYGGGGQLFEIRYQAGSSAGPRRI
jgi:hypothetical protein